LHDKLRPLLSAHLLKFPSSVPSSKSVVLLAIVIAFIPVGQPYTSQRADEHLLGWK